MISKRNKLLRIFSHYTASDLDSRSGILRLLRLAIASAGQPIREVHFAVKQGPSYVYARPAVVKRTVKQFLGVQQSTGPRGQLVPKGLKARRTARRQAANLESAPAAGREWALQAVSAGVKVYPIYYPTKRTLGALYLAQPRVYNIVEHNGKQHPAYRMVIKKGIVGEYYGIQGTTWKSPPILDGPHETHTIHGRKFDYYWDGTRLRLVAWHGRNGAVYWLSNTLLLTLSNKQMTSIAASIKHL